MFTAGIALTLYLLDAVIAFIGLIVIANGIFARRRGVSGRPRIIAGTAIILQPIGIAASSHLPGQS